MPKFIHFGGSAFSLGNYCDFDGSNDKIHLTDLNTGNGTFVYWFKPDTISYQCHFGRIDNNRTLIGVQSATKFRLYTASGQISDFTIPTLVAGNWYHTIVVNEPFVGSRVYINGVESSSGLQTHRDLGFSQIGAYGFGTVLSMNGGLDDIYYFDEVYATSGQVTTIYDNRLKASPEVVLGSAFNAYTFDNVSGTTVYDDGTEGNDATLVNFTSPPPYIIPR